MMWRGTLALMFLFPMLGCKATPPSKAESSVMKWTKHAVFVRNKSERNPLQFTEDNLAAGKEAFSHYCIAFHGRVGQNTTKKEAWSPNKVKRKRGLNRWDIS